MLLFIVLLGNTKEKQVAAMPTADVVSAVAGAQNLRNSTHAGCPRVHNGRALQRSVFHESDTQEPVLICFYVSAGAMK